MDKRFLVAMLGIAVLAVVALLGKSAVMLVSAGTIGIAVYLFRRARTRDRVVAIIAAGLGGSIGAEIVHTIYRFANVAEGGSGNGEFFMSAIIVGLMNAGAIIIVLIVTETWLKFIERN